MEIILFIPALLCVAGILRWGPQKTFVHICLPVMLLFPTYFYWRVQGFPEQDFSTLVLLPLGAAMIAPACARWRFSRTDFWMALYILSAAYADFRLGEASLAKYRLFDVIVGALIPYMAGKLLIEQPGARYETAKRLTLLLTLSCVVAIPEFFLKVNIFLRVGMHLFPGQWPGWWTQLRGGFGRVAGPFGTAEIYGMILIIALLLLLWMKRWNSPARPFSRARWISSKEAILLSLFLLLITLFMTQSRGPWLGALVALPIALVGRAKRVRLAALLVLAGFVLIAIPGYKAAAKYSGGPRVNYGTERETAQYRRDLIQSYLPLGEQGGLWGWGTFHPVRGGQPSIDNEFLRVFVVQGYVGILAYLLLILEAWYALSRAGFAAEPGEERHFCFTMFGILAGWAFTLFTVYMGSQSYPLFFLMVGWAQAVFVAPAYARSRISSASQRETLFRLNRIYT